MFDGLSGVRIQRQGNAEILRDIFGLKEVTFLDEVKRYVLPVAEIRAVRFWEEFKEGIMRWSLRAFQAAVVAEFSGVSVGFATGSPPPQGSIYVVDEIVNQSGQTIDIRRGTVINPVAAAVSVYSDSRWAPFNVQPPIVATQGSSAAPGGTLMDQMQTGTIRTGGVYVSPGFNPNVAEPLGIFGTTLNTSFSIVVRGRLIPSR